MKNRILLVLDSEKYKVREFAFRGQLDSICYTDFYYTDYENRLVKFLHGISGVGIFLSYLSYWFISFLFAVNILLFKRMKYDRKIFINPIVGAFYSFLSTLFNTNEKIQLAGFLFAPKKNRFYYSLRKKFVNYSYKNVSEILVYSTVEISYYSEIFPELAPKFKFLHYGRDYEIFVENEFIADGPYVASGGISNRDFDLLKDALIDLENKLPELKCKIATRPGVFSTTSLPQNLTYLFNVRIDTFGSFLKNAQFVIIPLKNNLLSAGHMALLEAMYLGKVILIADIPSVRDYVDEEDVFFYEPEDPKDLANKIQYLYLNRMNPDIIEKANNARIKYLSTYSFIPFLKRIIAI